MFRASALSALLSSVLLVASLGPIGSAEAAAPEPEPAPACDRGDTLQKLERTGEAEAAYLEDLKTKAGLACAPDKLTALAKAAKSCAVPKALADAGLKTKSEEALAKALEANPAAGCSAPEKSGKESLESTSGDAEAAMKLVGAIVAALALLIVLWLIVRLLVLQILTRLPCTRDRWPARKIRAPTLEVKDLDAGWMEHAIAPQVSSLIRAAVSPGKSGGLNIVTGHAALSETLKPIGEVAEAKAAVAVVSFLDGTLPRRQFEIGGALQPSGLRGRGISVELRSNQRNSAGTTLWAKEFEAADNDIDALQELAVPAAAWVDHKLASALGHGGELLSIDPRSWALVKAGAVWQAKGDDEKAGRLYDAALRIDPENGGALANLGLVELEQNRYDGALFLLGKGLARMKRVKSTEPRLNADWHRVKFNLAVLYANRSATSNGGTADRDEALKRGRELAIVILGLLDQPKKGDAVLRSFLEHSMLPAILILYAATREDRAVPAAADATALSRDQLRGKLESELASDQPTAQEAMSYITAKERMTPVILYGLACAQAQQSRSAGATELAKAAASLRRAMTALPADGRRRLAKRALSDPTLEPLRAGATWRCRDKDLRKLKHELEDWAKPAPEPEAKPAADKDAKAAAKT